MTELKIKRIDKSRFQIKNGKEVVRDNLASFKEANNALIAIDLEMFDNANEFLNDDDFEYMDDVDMLNLVAAC